MPSWHKVFSEPQSWNSHIHSVVLPVFCSIHTGLGPDLTTCFHLLQDKLRISTCDILHSVYTGVTEKMPLFLFQNTEKIPLGCPFLRQNSMANFCSMAQRLITYAKTKLFFLINTKKVSLDLPYEVLVLCANTHFLTEGRLCSEVFISISFFFSSFFISVLTLPEIHILIPRISLNCRSHGSTTSLKQVKPLYGCSRDKCFAAVPSFVQWLSITCCHFFTSLSLYFLAFMFKVCL